MSFYGTVRTLFQPIGKTFLRLQVEGLERLPKTGPAIVAANHVSWLDPIVVGAAFPRPIRFLIARSVYERTWTRWFYANMRTIPVDRASRDPGWLRSALRALAAEEVVGVFPEGAGLASGPVRDAKPGAGLLACMSGAPFVPAAVIGTREAWPPHRKLPRPGSVRVRFGEPYRPWQGSDRPGKDDLQRLMDALMLRIRAMEAHEGSGP